MSLATARAVGSAEVLRALAVLSESPHPSHTGVAEALDLGPAPTATDHTQALVLGAVPYASVYLGPEGMLGGEAADRIAGFWRAVGHVPPPEPDHLAALLGLLAALTEAEAAEEDPARAALRRRARSVLLWEHLLTWVPLFTRAVAGTGSSFHAAWAELLLDVLAAEAADLPAPDALPVALRSAPTLPDDAPGSRDLAAALLTPVRTGIVITRSDLARLARSEGMGLRIGERAFTLAALLDQDPATTLGRLADLADAWAAEHRSDLGSLGPVAAFWADRAASTSTTCRTRRHPTEGTTHVR